MPHVNLASAMLLALLAAPTLAQPAPPGAPPVIGVIAFVDGHTLKVTSGDGKTVSMNLPADATVTVSKKTTFSAIKPGDFIASAAVEQSDGKLHAQEVRIFPEAMRGRGEGHRPMAQPSQSMTNATVVEVVGTSGGGVLKTKYPNGTTDIVVDPQTPVTAILSADRSALKPGTKVSVRADMATDGTMTARTVALQ